MYNTKEVQNKFMIILSQMLMNIYAANEESLWAN